MSIVISICAVSTKPQSSYSALASSSSSPSFGLQQYVEPIDPAHKSNVWADANGTRNNKGPPYTNIQVATYQSDGHTLNATFWLEKNRFTKTDFKKGTIDYGIMIDSDSDATTGRAGGIDYQVEVTSQRNETWTSKIYSFAYDAIKTLNSHAVTFDAEPNQRFVTISLNLDEMGSPNKYRVAFYADSNATQFLINLSPWIYIPKPTMEISLIPTSSEITPASRIPALVHVESTAGFNASVQLVGKAKTDSVYPLFNSSAATDFKSKEYKIPAEGVIDIPILIAADSNAEIGPHQVEISAEPYFGIQSSETSLFGQKANVIISAPMEPSKVKSTFMSITVRDPWEAFLDWLNKVQFPITFIFGILTGFVGPWIYKRVGRKQRPDRRIDDFT